MKKLILFGAALLVASQASAYAQDGHAGRHHKRLMSSHAQIRGSEGGSYYRSRDYYAPPIVAPQYYSPPSYNNSPSYYDSDPTAEGRTSGG